MRHEGAVLRLIMKSKTLKVFKVSESRERERESGSELKRANGWPTFL